MTSDRSKHPTVVEYAVQELMKGKSPKVAAARTAKKLSGSENMFLGPGVSVIDPKILEEALWERLVEFAVNLAKSQDVEWAVASTLQHFEQEPLAWPEKPNNKMRAELQKRVEKVFGKS